MNKAFKYWMHLNTFLILAGLLCLPFVPYARLSSNSVEKEDVLAHSTSKFSEVFNVVDFEASMSSKEFEKTFKLELPVSNPYAVSRDFKIALQTEPNNGFEYNVIFAKNGSDTINLSQEESSDVFVILKRLGENLNFNGKAVVLSAL